MIATSPVCHRIVGAALRRYRQEVGYGLDDAARVLDCDRSKISRIETGHRGIRSRELRDLLYEYGVDERVQETLAVIANPRRVSGWWRDYADVLPDTSHDYYALELAASQIVIFAAQQVPSLLQTGEYARTVAAAMQHTADESHRLTDACRVRQATILAGSRPEVVVVLGEAALRQAVGGYDVMRAQLAALAHVSERFPQVSIRVLPFANGAHAAGDTSSFTILRYAEAPDIGVVHLPRISGGVLFADQLDVATWVSAFEHLKACALTPGMSARLIRDIRETYAADQRAG
jgi:transcriptional regulator with XRE-family HTH domain